MIHPLVTNLHLLDDKIIYEKIKELTEKYLKASNLYLQDQLLCILDCYKDELDRRSRTKTFSDEENNIDNLIKIN